MIPILELEGGLYDAGPLAVALVSLQDHVTAVSLSTILH